MVAEGESFDEWEVGCLDDGGPAGFEESGDADACCFRGWEGIGFLAADAVRFLNPVDEVGTVVGIRGFGGSVREDSAMCIDDTEACVGSADIDADVVLGVVILFRIGHGSFIACSPLHPKYRVYPEYREFSSIHSPCKLPYTHLCVRHN